MEKSTKLQELELQKLQDFQTNSQNLIIQLGQLQLSKFKIENEEKHLKNQLIQLETNELEISNELKEKYGNVQIDIKTGDLTYSKE